MPTLNAPLTATYTTSTPGEFVVVVATGANDAMLVSWVGPGGISGQRTVRNTTTNGEDIGPFTDQTAVTFTALSGSPGYTAPGIPAGVSGAWNSQFASGNALNRTLKRFTDSVGVGAVNSGTAATVSIDAASPFGRPAYKVAMPSGNTYHEVQLTGLNIANFDGHVIWSVWVEDYTAVTQIQAFAGTSGYSRLYQQTHNVSNSNLNRINGEHRIVVGALAAGVTNTFVGGTDTMADTKLRIFPGASGANVWIDVAVVPGVGRATHMITHDDCSVTWITNALPYLAQNNLRAAFGINTGDIGGNPALYLSSAQVQQIAAAGHTISPHNVTNTAFADGTGGTQTAAQYTADFVTASASLGALIGQALDTSYHPWVQGRTNQSVMDTMRAAGLRIARGTDGGYNFPQAGTGGHVLQLKNQALHTLTQPQIATICANAKKYGATICWMVHEITTSGGVGVETAMANYAYLCSVVGADVMAGLASNRTPQQIARELYSERLVPAALLA